MNLLNDPGVARYIELDPVVANSRLKESGYTVDAINTLMATRTAAATAALLGVPVAAINAAQSMYSSYTGFTAKDSYRAPAITTKRQMHSLAVKEEN